MSGEKILIVDDDRVVQKVLELKLGRAGYQVVGATDSNQAMEALSKDRPDLMILNLSLINDSELSGLLDGFSLLNRIRCRLKNATFPVIIHTADRSPNLAARAEQCKAFAVFKKGESLDKLVSTVRQALEAPRASLERKPAPPTNGGPSNPPPS